MKIDHIAMYVVDLEKARDFFLNFLKGKVNKLTDKLRKSGYEVISGPRTTGDGYYESCVVGIEGNQIEITV